MTIEHIHNPEQLGMAETTTAAPTGCCSSNSNSHNNTTKMSPNAPGGPMFTRQITQGILGQLSGALPRAQA